MILNYRQVHLDFHTSEAIEEVGNDFNKEKFQESLKVGHVNSVTCFAKCHHGWSYYDSEKFPRHPGLSFDLLRAQFDACKDIGVSVPVYISAGFDEYAARTNRGWQENFIDRELNIANSPLNACYRHLCFNSPYIDYLCEQIEEVVKLFPQCNGIFLDIISQRHCCCEYCLEWLGKHGLDANDPDANELCRKNAINRYYERTTESARKYDHEMPVFHNSGRIHRGKKDLLKYISHLEIESLPTGGWGYDNFPITAKYCENLPLDTVGMTGKFHTTWGEFGGYKHPNALRYECAAMLAYNTKCSVGDQLHPSGQMSKTTYNIIGQAYDYVERCEEFCKEAENVAEIGLLSAQSLGSGKLKEGDNEDIGASRILLEGHFLFDVLDPDMDFSKYKVLILPDTVSVSTEFKSKLDIYLKDGGRLMLTGKSGLDAEKGGFLFDIGADYQGESNYCPDYILPNEELRPDYIEDPMVMYLRSHRIKVTNGVSLGKVYDPYFNRSYKHFCSHQHTPYKLEDSGFDCGVFNNNIMYLAHPVFSLYRGFGAVVYREYITRAIELLLGKRLIKSNLPSTARINLNYQNGLNRYVLHILYANTINRGGPIKLDGGTKRSESGSIEIIEDLVELHDISVSLGIESELLSVTLQPQNIQLDYVSQNGAVNFKIDKLKCHQMVVIQLEK
ncbi:MAG: alpha-amylase family protein [Sedimentisphaeraceae bacterium JB056]